MFCFGRHGAALSLLVAANSYVGAPHHSPSLLDTVGLVVFDSTSRRSAQGLQSHSHLNAFELVAGRAERRKQVEGFRDHYRARFISYLQRSPAGFVSIEAALRQSGLGVCAPIALAQATSLRSSACGIASILKGRRCTLETSFQESDKWLAARGSRTASSSSWSDPIESRKSNVLLLLLERHS